MDRNIDKTMMIITSLENIEILEVKSSCQAKQDYNF